MCLTEVAAAAVPPPDPFGAPVVLLTDRVTRTTFGQVIGEEIRALVGDEHRVITRSSGGDPLKAKALLEQAWAEKGVRVVITVGVLASAASLGRASYPKPTIAMGVLEPGLQSAPLTAAGTTGVKNFGYLLNPADVKRDLQLLADVRPYRSLAILAPMGFGILFPQAEGYLRSRLPDPAINLSIVGGVTPATIGDLPKSVDAVYVLPLEHLSTDDRSAVYAALAARGLPSVALIGRPEVDLGAYASVAPATQLKKLARRAALDVSRCLDGQEPSTFPVDAGGRSEDLVFNIGTVRATGVYPPFALMGRATLVDVTAMPKGAELTLQAAVAEGLRENFGLRSARLDQAIAAENVRSARASLLPSLTASTSLVAIDSKRVDQSFGTRRPLAWSGQLELSQVVYSDPAWANLAVQALLAEATKASIKGAEVDLVREVVTAYLGLLQAKNLVRLQNDNVSVSKRNHDLAVARNEDGGGSEADVRRWESQLALGKMDLLDAEARLVTTRQSLNRLLGRDVGAPIDAPPMPLATVLATMVDGRVRTHFKNAGAVAKLADFMVSDALETAPGLTRVERSLKAKRRLSLTRQRRLWAPTVALVGNATKPFESWGEGAMAQNEPASSWDVALVASLPLFDGMDNYAQLQRARVEVRQLERDQDTAEQGVEARIRASMALTGRRFAKIQLARQAATASREYLRIVQQAYALGSAGIARLIDAQTALLRAELLAANSIYDFLSSYIDTEQARGWFYFLATPTQRDAFIARLRATIKTQGERP
jgi:outer membrane protein TolC